MNNLGLALEIIRDAAMAAEIIGGAAGSPEAAQGARLAQVLVGIVQKAAAAHESVLGVALDPDLIKPFTPLP